MSSTDQTGLNPFGEQHCIQATGEDRPSSSPFFTQEEGKVRKKSWILLIFIIIIVPPT